MTISRINPSPPLGQYPHPELYGHAGSAPIKSKIRIISRIVPMTSPFSNYVRQCEAFWTLGCDGQQGLLPDETILSGVCDGRERLANPATNIGPWHDVQVGLRGAAAADVYATLASRWESHAQNKSDRLPRAAMTAGARRKFGCGSK